ncbi:hypothetical protein PsYK624_154110 [Phanerochaete sordida]|uniref:Uncharacterized protein n=1 Tax=Phanerochaete sordida TaxID=48140 RepID=A0A9P3GRS2_9APHY|nr:hypothetical protein PsYK624_154110 [Phanerochaete sordida]
MARNTGLARELRLSTDGASLLVRRPCALDRRDVLGCVPGESPKWLVQDDDTCRRMLSLSILQGRMWLRVWLLITRLMTSAARHSRRTLSPHEIFRNPCYHTNFTFSDTSPQISLREAIPFAGRTTMQRTRYTRVCRVS